MKLKILRNWGSLKANQIIDAEGTTKQYLLDNQIASLAPNTDDCIGDCDDPDHECEPCKSKKKKRSAVKVEKPVDKKPAKKPAKKSVAKKGTAKAKKSTKKTASPKK